MQQSPPTDDQPSRVLLQALCLRRNLYLTQELLGIVKFALQRLKQRIPVALISQIWCLAVKRRYSTSTCFLAWRLPKPLQMLALFQLTTYFQARCLLACQNTSFSLQGFRHGPPGSRRQVQPLLPVSERLHALRLIECNKTFTGKQPERCLMRHTREVRWKQHKSRCNYCTGTFTREGNRLRHVSKYHEGGWPDRPAQRCSMPSQLKGCSEVITATSRRSTL